MDFNVRLASLEERLKKIENRNKIKALRERLRNKDFADRAEYIGIKMRISQLLNPVVYTGKHQSSPRAQAYADAYKSFHRKANAKDVDTDMARDIALSIVNDGQFYKRLLQMLSGIANHLAKGRYIEGGALKQCENIIIAYLPIYKKNNRMPYLRVNKATKELASRELLEDVMEQIEEMAEEKRQKSR